MRTGHANPGQAWDATITRGTEGGLNFLTSRGGWAAVSSSVLLTRMQPRCPRPQPFAGAASKPALGRKDAIRINHVITYTSRTIPMSHSYGHRVSLCFQKPRRCAKIFRTLSLLIGISKDIFAHWLSTDINGVMIPSVIVGDLAYPY